MKVLLIDAGNTRIKWAVIEAGAWLAEGALEHAALSRLHDDAVSRHPDIVRVLGSNVAGEAIARKIAAHLTPAGLSPEWLRSTPRCAGVQNSYDQPAQLGSDRWAALIGARALHAGPCLVVCAGTATTIDTLDRHGVFLGGMILPGETLMRHSLARDTAQLELASGQWSALPRNTADAIASGCRLAQAGAIELAFRRLDGAADACCLLSGGAARHLAPHLNIPLRLVDNLVLKGLAVIAGASDAAETAP